MLFIFFSRFCIQSHILNKLYSMDVNVSVTEPLNVCPIKGARFGKSAKFLNECDEGIIDSLASIWNTVFKNNL